MLKRVRRAPKACSWCHYRKVRCDAVINGCPCTRCRQDGRPCTMREAMSQRFSATSVNLEEGPQPGDLPSSQLMDMVNHQGVPYQVHYGTYSFLEFSGSSNLDSDTFASLSAQGALSVPSEPAVGQYIKQYFLHVHPCLPIVDEAAFWDIYYAGKDKHGQKCSLLLLQAMLFASSPYVSVETIQASGFVDKRAARNSLYHRAKLLLELGYDDSLVNCQAATLLSMHTSTDEPQSSRSWIAYAIQSAQDMAQDAELYPRIDPITSKRVWWSIVIRDMILSMGLRRPPQTARLFNILPQPMRDEDFEEEIMSPYIDNAETKRILVPIFQAQCQLALVVIEMLALIFPQEEQDSLPSLSLDEFNEMIDSINATRMSLTQWETNWRLSCPRGPRTPEDAIPFLSLTLMYYQTACVLISHHQALLIEKHLALTGDKYIGLFMENALLLRDAMSGLMVIMEYFSHIGQTQNLPLSVLAFVVMPLLVAAIDHTLSPSSTEITTRRQHLDCLGKIMQHSTNTYDITDSVSADTNQILRLAYVLFRNVFLRQGQTSTPVSSPYSRHSLINLPRGRVRNWYDAFMRHPRVYLLISSSVDHWLSFGCLPPVSALPDILHCTIPPELGAQLPWINAYSRTEARRASQTSQTSQQNQNDDSKRRLPNAQSVEMHSNPKQESQIRAGGQSRSSLGEQAQVNIDFLDFSAVPHSGNSPFANPEAEYYNGASVVDTEREYEGLINYFVEQGLGEAHSSPGVA